MELESIPLMDSVVLTGLDFSMNPDKVCYEVSKGFIKPFPEIKVMHEIKTLAILVYTQEKLTPYYHGNVCDGRNSLAFFICGVHRQSAPQSTSALHKKVHSRSSADSANSSTSGKSSCKSPTPGKWCELPKLVTTSMLPLSHWDGLYYALIAEIRLLYEDLNNRFGFCTEPNPILHNFGLDGTPDVPFTARDFASMLESAWYALMDSRLVAALDGAVRMRRLREDSERYQIDTATKQFMSSAKNNGENVNELDPKAVWELPPIVHGLMDVNALHPHTIINIIWDRQAPEVDRASCEDFEDESLFTAARAEKHREAIELEVGASSPLPSAGFCKCHGKCLCNIKCDKDADQCTCMNSRVEVYNKVHQKNRKTGESKGRYVKEDVTKPFLLGATSQTLAQMHVAARAERSSTKFHAIHNIYEANKSAHERKMARERSHTNDSKLAYVPDTHPTDRTARDANPTALYGRYSGQRYPQLHPQPYSTAAAEAENMSYSAMAATSTFTRKPVPAPILTSIVADGHDYDNTQEGEACDRAFTPSPSSSLNPLKYAKPKQAVSYPTIPTSQSEGMFTESFPQAVNNPNNPRNPYNTVFASRNLAPATAQDHAQDYIGLLGRHPSSVDASKHCGPVYPTLPHPATVSPYYHSTSALPTLNTFHNLEAHPQPPLPLDPTRGGSFCHSTTALPTLNTFHDLNAYPQPPLPSNAANLIDPPPAPKQRYVSAGGSARLSDRPEILAPEIAVTANTSGATMSKEEVDAKLQDPEWVRNTFGEAALSAMNSSTPLRPSVESSSALPLENGEGQGGDDREAASKRDRKSSGASGKVRKLKRVFSRKGSEGDGD